MVRSNVRVQMDRDFCQTRSAPFGETIETLNRVSSSNKVINSSVGLENGRWGDFRDRILYRGDSAPTSKGGHSAATQSHSMTPLLLLNSIKTHTRHLEIHGGSASSPRWPWSYCAATSTNRPDAPRVCQ